MKTLIRAILIVGVSVFGVTTVKNTPPKTPQSKQSVRETTPLTEVTGRVAPTISRQSATALDSLLSLFSTGTTYEEQGTMSESTNSSWWLNSGAYFNVDGATISTIQGSLPSNDPWRDLYNNDNPVDTDNGLHPQNIFRLISRTFYDNSTAKGYFTITNQNLSASPERDAWSGLLFFARYRNSDNLYYMGVRADGHAVIKSKKNGNYTTLEEVAVFPGTYNRNTNPNLLPEGTEIGLKNEVQTNPNGSVNIKLYIDNGHTGVWTLIAEATDSNNPVLGSTSVGVRTDFLDVKLKDYAVSEILTADTTPPTTPSNLTLISKTSSQVKFSWTAATDNRAVSGYKIYKNGTFYDSTRTATSITLSNLSPATTYQFTVKSYDEAGNLSNASQPLSVTTNGVTDTTAPIISNVLVSLVTQNNATISWITNENTDSQVEYGTTSSYGSSTALNLQFLTAHTTIVTGLSSNTTYHYRVVSKDAAGNSTQSADKTFATGTALDLVAPTAPTVSLLSKTSTTVHLSWTQSSDNVAVAGYRVYKNGVFYDVTQTSRTITVSNLTPNTTYSFTVRARDAAGNLSPVSNTLWVKTQQ